MGLHVPSYTSTCRESQLYTPSNVYSFGGSLTAGFCSRIWPDEVFISTMRSRPACFSVLFIGRHRSTTLTHSSALSLDISTSRRGVLANRASFRFASLLLGLPRAYISVDTSPEQLQRRAPGLAQALASGAAPRRAAAACPQNVRDMSVRHRLTSAPLSRSSAQQRAAAGTPGCCGR